MRVKIRVDDYTGEHVRLSVFAGKGETLAKLGTLAMRVPEYEAIRDALQLGATLNGKLMVEIDSTVIDERKTIRRVRGEI